MVAFLLLRRGTDRVCKWHERKKGTDLFSSASDVRFLRNASDSREDRHAADGKSSARLRAPHHSAWA